MGTGWLAPRVPTNNTLLWSAGNKSANKGKKSAVGLVVDSSSAQATVSLNKPVDTTLNEQLHPVQEQGHICSQHQWAALSKGVR